MTNSFGPRRLGSNQTVGPVRNLVIPQREFLALIGRPGVVTARSENGLVAGLILGPKLTTNYAFQGQGLMTDEFASLFREMLSEARQTSELDWVELTLEDNPSRPWAEPLYAEVGFIHLEEWVRLVLQEPEAWKAQEGLEKSLTIRDASETDLQTIADIDAACFGDRAWGKRGQEELLKTLAWTAVAEAGGKPVGYIQIQRTPENIGEIFELAVLPSERGKRYGSQLLEAALDWLKTADVRRVEVIVPTNQPESLDLMRRYGFSAHRSGNTYRRAADDRIVQAAAEEAKKRSFLLKFGDWR